MDSFVTRLLISAIILGFVGTLADWRGFSINILAGLAVMFVGFAFALDKIEKYTARIEANRWKQVRDVTLRQIAVHITELFTQTFTTFAVKIFALQPIINAREHPTTTVIPEMQQWIAILNDEENRAYNPNKSPSDMAVEYYEKMQWDLDQIQRVLTERVIQRSKDQELIGRLTQLDSCRRNLHHALIAHKEAVTESAFPYVIELLQAAAAVYDSVSQRLPRT